MPGKDDFDDVPELVTDELIEIPMPPVPKSTPPPLPKDEFLESINEFCRDYYEQSGRPRIPELYGGSIEPRRVPHYNVKSTGESSKYINAEKSIDIHADVQIAAVVNDCYILAAQIDREKGKKITKPVELPTPSDEEVAGDGIEDLMPELKK